MIKNVNIDQRVIAEARFYITNKSTVRKMEEFFPVKKTTIHYDLSKRLPNLNNDLYNKVLMVIHMHKYPKNYKIQK